MASNDHENGTGKAPEELPASESTPMAKFEHEERPPPPNRKFLYIAACVANLAGFVCGTSFGWTSPEIPKLKSNTTDNPLSRPISITEESWIGSLLPIGAALGPFIAGLIVDRLGRKNTILLGTVPFILAFLLSALASSVNFFYIARFLCGIAVGSIFTALPMYIGEISEDEVRGSLGSFMQLFITVGLLFSFIVGPYVPVKLFNTACILFPVFFIVTFYVFIPESPYFLVKKSRESAGRALAKLRGQKVSDVQEELTEIEEIVEKSQANQATFMDIFKSRGLTKALVLSVGLVSLQQFSGINIVLFYAQDIFTSAGSTIPGDISTIIIGVVQVIASALTPALVEKKGKRYLLILSALGMAASLGTLAFFFFLKDGKSPLAENLAIVPVLSLVGYIITYCLGFGPLPWAVMGELFPDNIKSVASTVTASGCWFLGFVITKYFSVLTDLVGSSGSFGFFALCCVGAAVFVHKYLPETSGRSLAEIQEILNS